jgi:hypothetical protein
MFDSVYTGTLPEQNLPPNEIVLKYGSIKNAYRLAAQYYARSYNKSGIKFNTQSQVTSNNSEFEEICRNWDMFHGLQATSMFAFLNQVMDDDGQDITDTAIPIQPGQETAAIFLFLQGLFLGVASGVDAKVIVLNQEIRNKITQKLKMVEVKRIFAEQIKMMEEASNTKYNAPADPSDGNEKILKAIYNSFSSGLQLHAGRLYDYIKQICIGSSDMLRSFTNQMVGRRSVLFCSEDGFIENIQPEYYASVSAKDNDFGRYDIARMFVQTMHKDEVIAKYQEWLSPEEIDQIKSGSFANTDIFNNYARGYGYELFNPVTNFMTGVTVYYKSTIDSGYIFKEDLEGNKFIRKLKNTSKRKGVEVQVLRKATIWSNMFVVDYGIAKTIDDPTLFGNKLFPILVFQPNTYRGINQCLADRMMWKQQQIDAIDNKITEMYTMDLGTIITLNGAKFDNGMTPQRVYNILKKNRVMVTKKSPDLNDPTNREPYIQREDVSLMRDIQQYITIKESFKNELKDIANVNNVTMGTPTSYVGFKTQQNSAAIASNSIQYSISGILQLWADASSLALENMRQRVIKEPGNPIFENLLGDEGINMIMDTKDIPFSQWMLHISTQDIIDPARKERMLRAMDMLMQSGQVNWRDWIEVEDAKTMSQLKDYSSYAVAKKKFDAEQQQMQQMAAQQQQQQMAAQAQIQGKQIDAESRMAQTAQNNTAKLADTALKQTGDPQVVAEMMDGGQGQQGGQQQQMTPEQQAQMMQG